MKSQMRLTRTSGSVGGLGGRPPRSTRPVSVPLASVDPMSHKIHPWSAETPELQKELPGHPIGIASLTFTPDGKKFASAGFDRTLKLWDVATGEELLRFEGFSGTVCQPRFSRDGWALSALDLGGPVARPEVFLWRTSENEPPTPGLGQSTKPTP